ncbi:MAG: DUF2157 domain-containing protein [Opitutaceae bacterium]|nr:DUF2157 domain-containing protein [Opitutaceae bacterium]
MNRHIRWVRTEIARWETDGLVTPEQGRLLRQRYPEPADTASWGTIVFASAGAVVVGLGVILLFAYNWDAIPKFAKLGLVFASLVAAHVVGLRWSGRDDWRRNAGATVSLLGTMLFGAGIWLIAQIYHIDEHYPNGFLLWALGAGVMAWALGSVLQAMLAAVLLAIWGGCDVLDFHTGNAWALLLVAVGIGPLAWRRQSAVLLGVVLGTVQFLMLANVGAFGTGADMMTTSLAWGAGLIAMARLMAGGWLGFGGGAGVASAFGYTTVVGCAYVMSFRPGWNYARDVERALGAEQIIAWVASWTVFALAAVTWGVVAVRAATRKLEPLSWTEWLVPVMLAYCYVLVWGRLAVFAEIGPHSFSLLLMGIAAGWMWRGCREGLLRPTVLGSLLLAAVVLARYADLFHSLATRGLAFLLLGGALMAEGIYFRRRRAALAVVEKAP